MKLGFVSAILDSWTYEEMMDFASEHGFECVEAACWPQGKAERRYAGVCHIDAEKVITGTFHGTVFSIKYNKSVLCYPTEKNRINKIRSLLSDMKIASRLLEVGCEDDFIPLLDTPMDYTETRNYIAQKIQEADDFLTGDKS